LRYVCCSRSFDTGKKIVKVSGGYDGDELPSESALKHTREKLGLQPGAFPLRFGRMCRGVGPQYEFPIRYTFLREPVLAGDGFPSKQGCVPFWLGIMEAMSFAAEGDTPLFDDFSLAQLAILLVNWQEL
jgi:hypothetical protein